MNTVVFDRYCQIQPGLEVDFCDKNYLNLLMFMYNFAPVYSWQLLQIASAENNVGDVIALFLLCNVSNTSQSKSAVNLFHSKLKRGSLPSSVLKKTIRVCSHIISSHFKSIKQLTQALV